MTRDLLTSFFSSDMLVFLYKLVFSFLLAGLLGLERERKGQPAGLRTHIVLVIGAMLAMCLSYYLKEGDPAISVDRIPGQVITGIGFLGAGAILHYGASIKGLTTAAGLWTSAVIGLAVGAGYYLQAAMTTFAVFFVIHLLESIEKRMLYTMHSAAISLQLRSRDFDIQTLFREFGEFHVSINQVSYPTCGEGEAKNLSVDFHLSGYRPIRIDEIVSRIKTWDGFEGITVKSEDK